MNKSWDSAKSGIAFNPETWAALAQHLHPGAWVMAFASSRGWHRLAVAIEDAGMVIQPSIFGWATGQSFPKATRIDTQIDKYNGYKLIRKLNDEIARARRESGLSLAEVGQCTLEISTGQYGKWYHRGGHMFFETGKALPSRPEWEYLQRVLPIADEMLAVYDEAEREVVGKCDNKIHFENLGQAGYKDKWNITVPATDLARAWVGHRYGGQVLKNALEPIICAQKPWQGKRLDCIVDTGAGALNVDGGRVVASGSDIEVQKAKQHKATMGNEIIADVYGDKYRRQYEVSSRGRWPANFTLQHDPGCQRVGVRKVKGSHDTTGVWRQAGTIHGNAIDGQKPTRHHTDPDGTETVADWRCTESCPVRRLGEQSGELKSGKREPSKRRHTDWDGWGMSTNGNEPSTGTAARFFYQSDWSYEIAERLALADPVRYVAKASSRERSEGLSGVVRLRSDLTEEQSQWVLAELQKAGVEPY